MSTVCLSHTNHFGLLSASEWTLLPLQTLLIPVQRGDLLQALQGTVWITLHGQPQDLGRAGDGVYTTNGNGHEVAWNNCQRLKANHVKASTSVTQPSTPPLLSGNHPALAAELQPL
jgi:hypothetical protein